MRRGVFLAVTKAPPLPQARWFSSRTFPLFNAKKPVPLKMKMISEYDDATLSLQGKRCLEAMGIKGLFPVQALSYEPIRSGKSVQIKSQTGSGKTLAYVVPIVERMLKSEVAEPNCPHVVVLVPSWELVSQVASEFKRYSNLMLSVVELTGGQNFSGESDNLAEGADVVVSTEGRLNHHLRNGTLTLRHLKVLVIDEADLMVHEETHHSLTNLLSKVGDPSALQTVLVAAMQPPWLRSVQSHPAFADPHMVSLTSSVDPATNPNIAHHYVMYPHIVRAPMVSYLCKNHMRETDSLGKILIFCSRKSECELISTNPGLEELNGGPIPMMMLDGQVGYQAKARREMCLEYLQEGTTRILVATDVAGRGLNVKGLSLVINIGLPRSTTAYVYRAGRVGRGGAFGKVITMLSPGDDRVLSQLQVSAKVRLSQIEVPPSEMKHILAESNAQKKMRSQFGLFAPEKNGLLDNQSLNSYHRDGNASSNSSSRVPEAPPGKACGRGPPQATALPSARWDPHPDGPIGQGCCMQCSQVTKGSYASGHSSASAPASHKSEQGLCILGLCDEPHMPYCKVSGAPHTESTRRSHPILRPLDCTTPHPTCHVSTEEKTRQLREELQRRREEHAELEAQAAEQASWAEELLSRFRATSEDSRRQHPQVLVPQRPVRGQRMPLAATHPNVPVSEGSLRSSRCRRTPDPPPSEEDREVSLPQTLQSSVSQMHPSVPHAQPHAVLSEVTSNDFTQQLRRVSERRRRTPTDAAPPGDLFWSSLKDTLSGPGAHAALSGHLCKVECHGEELSLNQLFFESFVSVWKTLRKGSMPNVTVTLYKGMPDAAGEPPPPPPSVTEEEVSLAQGGAVTATTAATTARGQARSQVSGAVPQRSSSCHSSAASGAQGAGGEQPSAHMPMRTPPPAGRGQSDAQAQSQPPQSQRHEASAGQTTDGGAQASLPAGGSSEGQGGGATLSRTCTDHAQSRLVLPPAVSEESAAEGVPGRPSAGGSKAGSGEALISQVRDVQPAQRCLWVAPHSRNLLDREKLFGHSPSPEPADPAPAPAAGKAQVSGEATKEKSPSVRSSSKGRRSLSADVRRSEPSADILNRIRKLEEGREGVAEAAPDAADAKQRVGGEPAGHIEQRIAAIEESITRERRAKADEQHKRERDDMLAKHEQLLQQQQLRPVQEVMSRVQQLEVSLEQAKQGHYKEVAGLEQRLLAESDARQGLMRELDNVKNKTRMQLLNLRRDLQRETHVTEQERVLRDENAELKLKATEAQARLEAVTCRIQEAPQPALLDTTGALAQVREADLREQHRLREENAELRQKTQDIEGRLRDLARQVQEQQRQPAHQEGLQQLLLQQAPQQQVQQPQQHHHVHKHQQAGGHPAPVPTHHPPHEQQQQQQQEQHQPQQLHPPQLQQRQQQQHHSHQQQQYQQQQQLLLQQDQPYRPHQAHPAQAQVEVIRDDSVERQLRVENEALRQKAQEVEERLQGLMVHAEEQSRSSAVLDAVEQLAKQDRNELAQLQEENAALRAQVSQADESLQLLQSEAPRSADPTPPLSAAGSLAAPPSAPASAVSAAAVPPEAPPAPPSTRPTDTTHAPTIPDQLTEASTRRTVVSMATTGQHCILEPLEVPHPLTPREAPFAYAAVPPSPPRPLPPAHMAVMSTPARRGAALSPSRPGKPGRVAPGQRPPRASLPAVPCASYPAYPPQGPPPEMPPLRSLSDEALPPPPTAQVHPLSPVRPAQPAAHLAPSMHHAAPAHHHASMPAGHLPHQGVQLCLPAEQAQRHVRHSQGFVPEPAVHAAQPAGYAGHPGLPEACPPSVPVGGDAWGPPGGGAAPAPQQGGDAQVLLERLRSLEAKMSLLRNEEMQPSDSAPPGQARISPPRAGPVHFPFGVAGSVSPVGVRCPGERSCTDEGSVHFPYSVSPARTAKESVVQKRALMRGQSVSPAPSRGQTGQITSLSSTTWVTRDDSFPPSHTTHAPSPKRSPGSAADNARFSFWKQLAEGTHPSEAGLPPPPTVTTVSVPTSSPGRSRGRSGTATEGVSNSDGTAGPHAAEVSDADVSAATATPERRRGSVHSAWRESEVNPSPESDLDTVDLDADMLHHTSVPSAPTAGKEFSTSGGVSDVTDTRLNYLATEVESMLQLLADNSSSGLEERVSSATQVSGDTSQSLTSITRTATTATATTASSAVSSAPRKFW